MQEYCRRYQELKSSLAPEVQELIELLISYGEEATKTTLILDETVNRQHKTIMAIKTLLSEAES